MVKNVKFGTKYELAQNRNLSEKRFPFDVSSNDLPFRSMQLYVRLMI